MADDDNVTWLLDAGDRVIEKKAAESYSSLSPHERLTYCLWVADYGMRNAGDLATATDLHPTFLDDGRSAARELGLPSAAAAFAMPSDELAQSYFELFDEVVSEIRNA
jgi:hypothetical protein